MSLKLKWRSNSKYVKESCDVDRWYQLYYRDDWKRELRAQSNLNGENTIPFIASHLSTELTYPESWFNLEKYFSEYYFPGLLVLEELILRSSPRPTWGSQTSSTLSSLSMIEPDNLWRWREQHSLRSLRRSKKWMDYEQAMAYNTGFSFSTQTVRTNSLFPYFGGKTRGVSKVSTQLITSWKLKE